MNYWLLTTEFPPQYGGGIGTYCQQWTNILAKKGDNITVFLPNRAISTIIERQENNVRIVEFSPYLKDTSSYLGYETMQSYSFAEVIRIYMKSEGAPDWLEAQEYNGIAYFILQRKQLGEKYYADLSVLITCHAPSFLYFEFNHINTYKLPYFWIGEMEKYCIQAADVCIAPSQYIVGCIKERFSFDRDIYVVHNPFQALEYQASSILEDKAIFLAKLSPSKGILQTLRTFKTLWNKGFRFKLKLVGDRSFFYHAKQCMMGSLIENEYSKYISDGRLEIADSMAPNQVLEEIASAKVILVPSTVDNFPYTVLESMANRKLVLASQQGGHREIISDGQNGLLFDHNDIDTFENKVQEAFSYSNARLLEIGINAAKTIYEKCDPENFYETKVSILHREKVKAQDENIYKFTRQAPAVDLTSDNRLEEQPKLLSVVIPYYNMGNYIEEAINSVRNSLYKSKEIVIVNDGSDDIFSLKKLKDLGIREDIKIVSQPNRGLAAARNAGALAAQGEYLAFLDADDMVHPDYYSRAIEVLKTKSNVHFVGCWVQYFEGSKGVWPSLHPEPPYLLYHNMVNSSALVYKRHSFLQAGKNDEKFIYGMEDYDSVVSMVKNGFKGLVIPDILFFYRVRKGSMARGFNVDNKAYLYQILAEKHKHFYANFATEITNLLNANGPGFSIDNPTMDYHLYSNNTLLKRYIQKVHMLLKHKPLLKKFALAAYNLIN